MASVGFSQCPTSEVSREKSAPDKGSGPTNSPVPLCCHVAVWFQLHQDKQFSPLWFRAQQLMASSKLVLKVGLCATSWMWQMPFKISFACGVFFQCWHIEKVCRWCTWAPCSVLTAPQCVPTEGAGFAGHMGVKFCSLLKSFSFQVVHPSWVNQN